MGKLVDNYQGLNMIVLDISVLLMVFDFLKKTQSEHFFFIVKFKGDFKLCIKTVSNFSRN